MKVSKTHFKAIHILLIACMLTACSSLKNRKIEKNLTERLNLNGFDNHFTGFMVYAPESQDTLMALNAHKFFTPASNTKIFTLYTALKILGDSIPSLRYYALKDTVYFQGTGYPGSLHPAFNDSSIVQFLQSFQNLVYVPANFPEGRFGPGWAWEDFDSAFSPERSSLPLYGNVLTYIRHSEPEVVPEYFTDSISTVALPGRRLEHKNTFYFNPGGRDSLTVPFKTGIKLTADLLEIAIKKPITIKEQFPEGKKTLLYGNTPADSLYKQLMEESDNFIAEQLLLTSSAALTDTLSSRLARDFVLDTYLSELEDHPRWVDGSGLSRYNLFTPASMIHVLEKLYKEFGTDRILTIFPAGGKEGTLEDWYGTTGGPYVFAKSGTLGNTYCLSGYMITSSGRFLLFSFMNNHFMESSSQLKPRIEVILEAMRDSY
ncbi:D-alanyl-D-alanine carboxypeptidase [Muriicola soli]|uniref:D-alanyl-D-alanine carboxypeptidase n=1 Tax=Muriicola soli TaxID=2507538 RepID=A0A411E9W1_9FLAO|nr:D-alanyl-D-alanine carboxypeptidase [Muriicola soli]QBA64501.1 D-alanyl-D-alanine carboxypeptidase [Muriicola soli]